MDDELVLVDQAAPDEAGGERRPADLEVAAEVPPELLEDRLRLAAREAPRRPAFTWLRSVEGARPSSSAASARVRISSMRPHTMS
jgi:hypothetical protein